MQLIAFICALGFATVFQTLPLGSMENSVLREAEMECNQLSNIHVSADPNATKVVLDVSYPYHRTQMNRPSNLEEEWKYLLLEDLFQNRMEQCVSAQFPIPEDALSFLLWQVELMKMEGFSEEEFTSIKQGVMQQSQSFATSNDSLQILQSLQYDDLIPYLSSFLADDHRVIQVIYPESAQYNMLTVQKIEEIIQNVSYLASFYRTDVPASQSLDVPSQQWTYDIATVEQLPIMYADLRSDTAPLFIPINDPFHSFYQLPLPEKEKRMIFDLIKVMAEKNIWGLLFKKRELERVGKRINHVHPLRFMGFILSDQKLRRYLKEVKMSSFKWDHFIDGFAKRMKEEGARNNVYPHVAGFAHLLEADENTIKEFIGRGDYEGLVKFLM